MKPVERVLNARVDPRDVAPTGEQLAAAGTPWGSLGRVIRAGSLATELAGLDASLASLVDDQYAGFVEGDASGAPGPRRRAVMSVVRSPQGRWLHLSKGEGFVEEARVAARCESGWMDLWSYGFAARLHPGATEARLLLCDGSDLERAQAVENALRFFIAAQALAAGGFLLHSAGVARGGRAFLFFGPSGAGKSTTASHAPADADLLGDDLVLVEPADGAWRACGVPFRGSFARGRNASTCAPVAMACRLFQADTNRLEDAPAVLRVSELLAQVPFLLDEGTQREQAARAVERFVRETPVRRLHLRRDGSYWPLLEA